MQVIWALALQHPLSAVTHEVTLLYIGQIQDSSLSCFAMGHTSSSMGSTYVLHWDNHFFRTSMEMVPIVQKRIGSHSSKEDWPGHAKGGRGHKDQQYDQRCCLLASLVDLTPRLHTNDQGRILSVHSHII